MLWLVERIICIFLTIAFSSSILWLWLSYLPMIDSWIYFTATIFRSSGIFFLRLYLCFSAWFIMLSSDINEVWAAYFDIFSHWLVNPVCFYLGNEELPEPTTSEKPNNICAKQGLIQGQSSWTSSLVCWKCFTSQTTSFFQLTWRPLSINPVGSSATDQWLQFVPEWNASPNASGDAVSFITSTITAILCVCLLEVSSPLVTFLCWQSDFTVCIMSIIKHQQQMRNTSSLFFFFFLNKF